MRVKLLLVPSLLVGALLAGAAFCQSGEKTLEVRYYDPRHFSGADVPFSIAPPETLPESVVTADWVRAVVAKTAVVVEVCGLMKDPRTGEWRRPQGFQERKRYCSAYQ